MMRKCNAKCPILNSEAVSGSQGGRSLIALMRRHNVFLSCLIVTLYSVYRDHEVRKHIQTWDAAMRFLASSLPHAS